MLKIKHCIIICLFLYMGKAKFSFIFVLDKNLKQKGGISMILDKRALNFHCQGPDDDDECECEGECTCGKN